MERLQNLRVVVTGSAAGIGRSIVEAFVREGALVHLCDVARDRLGERVEALPGVSATRADVSDPTDVDRLFVDVVRQLGGLDVLVNNAGIAGPTAAVEDVDLDDWSRTFAVNITGQFLCARRAVPLLKKAGGGAIINLASAAGRNGYPLRTPYASSKWAVIGFTQSLALELGPHSIRVNALLPGVVKGSRMHGVINRRAEQEGVSFDVMEQAFLSLNAMQCYVTGDEIAEMAVYLASHAGRHVSGQSIGICGYMDHLR